MTTYEAVIGLETHVQLNTITKIFCACRADSWQMPPNSNICPVCTGLPGVLPVLNKTVVEKGVRLAAAMNSKINDVSFFDRKNYFYPDLPKGYQITQYDVPIAEGGYLDFPVADGGTRRVRLRKMHLEEDAGKTRLEGNLRYVDFNRCGVPLIEIVTEPDLRSAEDTAQYLIRLRQLLRWLDLSEANMERGQMRCDANISIRPVGSDALNTKTEIKNVNSIDAIQSAIANEIKRQIREVQAGNEIHPWTLDWDDNAGVLRMMRSKETEADYRYFREPDLLPVRLTPGWKQAILEQMPELPLQRRQRFMDEYALPEYDSDILTSERSLSDYFEETVRLYAGDPKKVSNWLMNDVLRLLNEKNITADRLHLTPVYLADILKMVDQKSINTNTGKTLLVKVEESSRTPAEIVKAEGLVQLSDDHAIRLICEAMLSENPSEVESYRAGKTTLLGWFVGQVMRKSGGKVNPNLARGIIEELLK
ncbi:MAG: Asp-tRNA(Asn)/Glu-tRNA(Gln) amidotransferase subunit GatB [Chloroflexi bacterium]|nr:Asp-tRNA(Asn)/Glu-tRNA(Gln) amidotransferase subunit GatB [Chloroflexota bacterium]